MQESVSGTPPRGLLRYIRSLSRGALICDWRQGRRPVVCAAATTSVGHSQGWLHTQQSYVRGENRRRPKAGQHDCSREHSSPDREVWSTALATVHKEHARATSQTHSALRRCLHVQTVQIGLLKDVPVRKPRSEKVVTETKTGLTFGRQALGWRAWGQRLRRRPGQGRRGRSSQGVPAVEERQEVGQASKQFPNGRSKRARCCGVKGATQAYSEEQ